MEKDYYYDISVQLWDEDDHTYYSVIQSFSADEEDTETLAYGFEEDHHAALERAREAVLAALK
jgi:hypothetical protein